MGDTPGDDSPRIQPPTGGPLEISMVPCGTDEECPDGPCVQGPEGAFCAEACDNHVCPEGQQCQVFGIDTGNPQWFCFDPMGPLCQPCSSHADCNPVTELTYNLCLSRGDEGSYCGMNCGTTGSACPAGYTCEDAIQPTGEFSRQCVPFEQACACNALGSTVGMQTGCGLTNEHGTCEGTRACGPDGLEACAGAYAEPHVSPP